MAQPAHKQIEIDEDMRHQRLEWRLQRIGWVIGALFLLAGALGLLGYGAMSRTRAGGAGISVEYDRFQRSSSLSEYRIDVDRSLAVDGRVRLRFDDALLHAVEIERIQPEPERTVLAGSASVMEFPAVAGNGTASVIVSYRPMTFGRVRGSIAAEGGPRAVLDQIVYP